LRRGYTVAEAAAANDFTDQSHFGRHFRRIWGLTPREYLKAPETNALNRNSVLVRRR
jgi:AraC-like DNA-binding protein